MSVTVSAVVSTYNSPEKLRVALRSIELQSQKVNEIIVVGDSCSRETEAVLQELNLPNLRFLNLPLRCGEQSIPNAVGTLLATSQFVAYLNHDDLWLPSHISLALETLSRHGKSWFIGSAAFCEDLEENSGQSIPIFGSRNDSGRSVGESISRVRTYLEPSSSWVVEREQVIAAKNWTPAWKIGRTPVAELALRLWRAKGEPVFGQEISVAKVLGERRNSPGPLYTHEPSLHRYLEILLSEQGHRWPGEISWPTKLSRRRLRYDEALFKHLQGGRRAKKALTLAILLLYRLTGIDLGERALRNRFGAGGVLERALKVRTGEQSLGQYEVSELVTALGLPWSGND
ncbi:glycosyltransferase [Pontimonas sp.]|nr:glycosyltransferase [Pontimonas sp.]MDA9116846.1 glycosyltransferase [Pontimonas sp.]